MRCMECGSSAVSERPERTARGYCRFRCRNCGKQFNERSWAAEPNPPSLQCHRPRGVLAPAPQDQSARLGRNVPLIRGIVFSYDRAAEQIDGRDWKSQAHAGAGRDSVAPPAPQDRPELVCQRNLPQSPRLRCYLYRAIDTSGARVDVRLSETRDMAAATAFFGSAQTVTGITPARVTTDGRDSYPRATEPVREGIRTELGEGVCAIGRIVIPTIGLSRITAASRVDATPPLPFRALMRVGPWAASPMRGFKSRSSAARFCRSYGELRSLLRSRSNRNQHAPADHRRLHVLFRSPGPISILKDA
jgi:putative transposase